MCHLLRTNCCSVVAAQSMLVCGLQHPHKEYTTPHAHTRTHVHALGGGAVVRSKRLVSSRLPAATHLNCLIFLATLCTAVTERIMTKAVIHARTMCPRMMRSSCR